MEIQRIEAIITEPRAHRELETRQAPDKATIAESWLSELPGPSSHNELK